MILAKPFAPIGAHTSRAMPPSSNRKIIARTRTTALLLTILLTAGILAGCGLGRFFQTTAGTSAPAGSTSTNPANTTTASGDGTTATSGSNTSTPGETTSGSTAESSGNTETQAPPVDLRYHPLAANQVHRVDLDGDGQDESVEYACLDESSFNLTLGENTSHFEGDNFLPGWFFLVDLDIADAYLDIAVQEEGSSNDYFVTFLYYNGSRLVRRGIVPGMLCDTTSATIGKDPFGTGDIRLDGQGGLVARARGAILHTWFYNEPWHIAADQQLAAIPQAYYPMTGWNAETMEPLPYTPVRLKMDLPLQAEPGGAVVATALSGQAAELVQTDDQSWIQLKTQDGQLGWFRVQNFFEVMINSQAFFSDEVFDGLSFAD